MVHLSTLGVFACVKIVGVLGALLLTTVYLQTMVLPMEKIKIILRTLQNEVERKEHRFLLFLLFKMKKLCVILIKRWYREYVVPKVRAVRDIQYQYRVYYYQI